MSLNNNLDFTWHYSCCFMVLFTGKMIKAAYVPLPTYHNLFPESVQATQLLMPTRRWSLELHFFSLSLFNIQFLQALTPLCMFMPLHHLGIKQVYVVILYVQPFLFPFLEGLLTPYCLYSFQGLFSSTHCLWFGMSSTRRHVQLPTQNYNCWIFFWMN